MVTAQVSQDSHYVSKEESHCLLVLSPDLLPTHKRLHPRRLEELVQPAQVPEAAISKLVCAY